jgi:hypothetical protein
LLVFDEAVAALRQVRRGRRIGLPLRSALHGRAAARTTPLSDQ